jgi:membrane protein YdbS with pleckstrin-like domain
MNDPEQELWQGTFSPKGMLGTGCSVAMLSLLALVGGVLLYNQTDGVALLVTFGLTLLMWVWFGITLMYRRMTVRYRLTSQRFFHESGLLRRIINRIDVIDMDDITTEQGLLDRMVGVGTIRVASSDRTHPVLNLRGIDHVQDVAGKFDAARRKERVRRGMFIEAV